MDGWVVDIFDDWLRMHASAFTFVCVCVCIMCLRVLGAHPVCLIHIVGEEKFVFD